MNPQSYLDHLATIPVPSAEQTEYFAKDIRTAQLKPNSARGFRCIARRKMTLGKVLHEVEYLVLFDAGELFSMEEMDSGVARRPLKKGK
ncbi:MAG: hypothetical protein ACK5OC_13895 [Pirellula sp.]|jgi:hypothetical protein